MATHPDTPDENPKSHPTGNAEKDPHDWTTGSEPMTGAQASYLKKLSEEAGEEFDPGLMKADASLKIDELQANTGRGRINEPLMSTKIRLRINLRLRQYGA